MTYSPSSEWLIDVRKGNVPKHSIVHKFGYNGGIANGSFELVDSLSRTNPPFLASAQTVKVKAGGNVADVDTTGAGARTITIEGIDDSLAYASEDISLAGASASSATSTSFWRINRVFVKECGTLGAANTGNIVIENNAGTTDLIEIPATLGQSQFAQYSVATGYTAYIMSMHFTVDSTAAGAADFQIYSRENFTDISAPVSPRRLQYYLTAIEDIFIHDANSPGRGIPGPADIWVIASGNGGTASVTADFELLLVQD